MNATTSPPKTKARKGGWFVIPGVQSGDRTLAEQMKGLGGMVERCKGKFVLDLGCAEGLIAKYLLEQGADRVHGIEIVAAHVEIAQAQCAGLNATFQVADLNRFVVAPDAYAHVVLLLSSLHKLREPARCLRLFQALALELVVIRLPAPVIRDERSGFKPCDVPAVMKECGWRLASEPRGPRGEWIGYFEKVGGPVA